VISPNCFLPRPEVQSAILRMKKREALTAEPSDRGFFFGLTKYAFGQRRKQMQKILSSAPPPFSRSAQELQKMFSGMGIDPRARPGELSLERWIQLANRLRA
jgi:16S rRNA (adenine1518-N6/adenine1519-N6)-dimethyltransferase